jgi:hypothetical protein
LAAIYAQTADDGMHPTRQVPEHLREDFCGTALISATWCRGDVRRTAIGLDIDRQALQWGLTHNGDGLVDEPRPRLSLFQGDVRHPMWAAEVVNSVADAPTDATQALARMRVTAEGGADLDPPVDDTVNGSAAQRDSRGVSAAQHESRQHVSEGDDEDEADGDGGSCAAKPVDISCALNFSVCLLHLRSDVVVRPPCFHK